VTELLGGELSLYEYTNVVLEAPVVVYTDASGYIEAGAFKNEAVLQHAVERVTYVAKVSSMFVVSPFEACNAQYTS